MNILVVDDNVTNRKLLRVTLEAENLIVFGAADGMEALQVLDIENIDVVISDILMPAMDGYRLCFEMRKSERYRNIPFIFCSNTYTSPADEQLAMQLGAQKFLRKPVDAGVIVRAVRDVMGKPAAVPPSSVRYEEIDVLKEYNERLVAKLEDKNIELQKRAEELLRLSRVVEQATDSVVITGSNGVIQYVNHVFEKNSGYSSAEVVGKTPRIIKSGKHDALFYETLWSTILSGKTFRAEFINKRKNGDLFFEEETISSILNEQGDITHFVSSGRDITSRKRAEDELRFQKMLLESQNEASIDGILNVDKDGKIVWYNQRFVEMWGIDNEVLQESSDEKAMNSVFQKLNKPEEFVAKVKYMYEQQHIKSLDEISLKDGRTFERYSSPVTGADGTYMGRLWLFRDVTERKTAEVALGLQTSYFRQLFDNSPAAVALLDERDNTVNINPSFQRVFQYALDDLKGKPISDFIVPPEKMEEARQIILTTLTGTSTHMETQRKRKDGSLVYVQLIRYPVVMEDKHVGVYCIYVDITEQKRLEAQYLRAQRMESIGVLAGGIAHDLNNVLSPILMAVDIFKRKYKDPEDQKILNTVESSALRGAGMVKQVLTFARGMEGEFTVLNISHLIKEVGEIIHETFPKLIQLKVDLPRDLYLLKADPTQLHQLLLNLCINARDAMPDGGTLTLAAENASLDENYSQMNIEAKPGYYIMLTVADTGTGIPHHILGKIFEPFFTTKEIGKGTGLGLSTVHTIVKSHGGFVNVYSEVGKGTRFHVYLPAQASASEQLEADEKKELHAGNGETILVVDDESSIRDICHLTLTAYGYKVISASDGTEAIVLYAQHRNEIDLVITDMMMPFMDGTATIRALRKLNPGIRIIAASGLTEYQEAIRNESLNVQGFLQKPYTAEKMLRAIHDALPV